MARIVTGALLAAGLLACTPAPVPEGKTFAATPIYSAQALGPITGGVKSLAFAPNASIPWEGRILIAPANGGLVVYDIEGKQGTQVGGPVYKSLAVQPGFSLRKLKTSFVLAVAENGVIAPMILDDARGQIFAAPLAGLDFNNAQAVCNLPSVPGKPKFAIARSDGSFEQWQIEDTGADSLQAKMLASAKLAVPIRHCTSASDKIHAIGSNGGIYVIDATQKPVIETGVDAAHVNLVAVAVSADESYLLANNGVDASLAQFDQDLQQTGALSAVASLSNPPVELPGALAITTWSYGGAGFSAGLLAITDNSNGRVLLVVRDTLPGFTHDREAR
ncbi:hypothetical protein MNBD_ALPHA06-547 [hydrothermal vent metagenome]|uniref:BPP domain-containing protein n=1 Tax=hydrothermal vent metagenome TaxID=652676 RepID=A0A3B0R6V9_9ZZZZ